MRISERIERACKDVLAYATKRPVKHEEKLIGQTKYDVPRMAEAIKRACAKYGVNPKTVRMIMKGGRP